MSKRRLVSGSAALSLLIAFAAAVVWAQDQGPRAFKPPRVAVVDVNQVFELYNKKKDRKDEFEVQVKTVDETLKAYEKRYKEIQAELPNLEPGKKKDEMELEKFKLEQQNRSLKETEMGRLRELELKYLQEMRDEITDEIQNYAKALDLDLVLEKTLNAELGRGAGIRWPIVHFAKPELEITQEIADRLNGRYKPSRAAAPLGAAGQGAAVPPTPGTQKPAGTPKAPGKP